ncbi:SLC13 family permease [Planctomicrobium piriforme]|uniref:Di-and tricarboxylate transporter n=1 Tax=Planctomicrobium piriforme TaxID=1576369 RepID=A0A1I3PY23_9PLAN|nr:SLC13 family permease [Planctomicrobium piriforme]SFJ26330.1 Di-and tricarboxylate transporter [Planctomicrobium piriforme]
MNFELLTVLALLLSAIVMFAINQPRMDAVALLMLTALPFTGAVTMSESLAGFADPNIVLIAALFVIGDGLVRTGVARLLGDWLTARAGSSEVRLLVLLMLVVCGLGSTMSSTAVTAIFIPVVLRISRSTGTAPGKLMMPLSMAALISGMMTLVATAPNLVVNSELIRQGATGFRFFSFTPFGAPVLVLCIIYMLFARRWLPGHVGDSNSGTRGRPSLSEWVERYKLANREHRVRVSARSPLVGRTLAELGLRNKSGANLLAIERDRMLIQPTPKTAIKAEDILLIDLFAESADVAELRQQYHLEELPFSGSHFTDHSQDLGMAEVILPADSELVGQTVAEARLRDRTGLTVIGLRRRNVAEERNLQHVELELGDTLLLMGPWKAIQSAQSSSNDFITLSLPREYDDVLPVPGKSLQSLFCLGLVILLMVTGLVPNVQAALIGCLLMGLLGCVNLESAYRSIDWKTIVLIVGMLPFSIALQRTGGVELASDALLSITNGLGVYGVLATLFCLTALLGMFISNTATAVLMAPVALSMAEHLSASPYPFAMIVALAASTAFMTPVSSPVNTLVVTPGNYTFSDFLKIGVPFSMIVMIVSVLMVPWLLPLY